LPVRKGQGEKKNNTNGDGPDKQEKQSTLFSQHNGLSVLQAAKPQDQGQNNIRQYSHLQQLDVNLTDCFKKSDHFTKKQAGADTKQQGNKYFSGQAENGSFFLFHSF